MFPLSLFLPLFLLQSKQEKLSANYKDILHRKMSTKLQMSLIGLKICAKLEQLSLLSGEIFCRVE